MNNNQQFIINTTPLNQQPTNYVMFNEVEIEELKMCRELCEKVVKSNLFQIDQLSSELNVDKNVFINWVSGADKTWQHLSTNSLHSIRLLLIKVRNQLQQTCSNTQFYNQYTLQIANQLLHDFDSASQHYQNKVNQFKLRQQLQHNQIVPVSVPVSVPTHTQIHHIPQRIASNMPQIPILPLHTTQFNNQQQINLTNMRQMMHNITPVPQMVYIQQQPPIIPTVPSVANVASVPTAMYVNNHQPMYIQNTINAITTQNNHITNNPFNSFMSAASTPTSNTSKSPTLNNYKLPPKLSKNSCIPNAKKNNINHKLPTLYRVKQAIINANRRKYVPLPMRNVNINKMVPHIDFLPLSDTYKQSATKTSTSTATEKQIESWKKQLFGKHRDFAMVFYFNALDRYPGGNADMYLQKYVLSVCREFVTFEKYNRVNYDGVNQKSKYLFPINIDGINQIEMCINNVLNAFMDLKLKNMNATDYEWYTIDGRRDREEEDTKWSTICMQLYLSPRNRGSGGKYGNFKSQSTARFYACCMQCGFVHFSDNIFVIIDDLLGDSWDFGENWQRFLSVFREAIYRDNRGNLPKNNKAIPNPIGYKLIKASKELCGNTSVLDYANNISRAAKFDDENDEMITMNVARNQTYNICQVATLGLDYEIKME